MLDRSFHSLSESARLMIEEANSLTEALREDRLQKVSILDSAPEKAYDDIVEIAAKACGTESAAITFFEKDRAFVKSVYNFGEPCVNYPSKDSFCMYTNTLQNYEGQPTIIADARLDPRLTNNPWMNSGAVRLYVGLPIFIESEVAVGTLCVTDTACKPILAEYIQILQALTRLTTHLVVSRR